MTDHEIIKAIERMLKSYSNEMSLQVKVKVNRVTRSEWLKFLPRKGKNFS